MILKGMTQEFSEISARLYITLRHSFSLEYSGLQ
jgi:hypothetical protein